MTLDELYRELHETGEFPYIRFENPSKSLDKLRLRTGKISVIRETGIGVRFLGTNYDTWFWSEKGKDNRKRYMYQLKIVIHGTTN